MLCLQAVTSPAEFRSSGGQCSEYDTVQRTGLVGVAREWKKPQVDQTKVLFPTTHVRSTRVRGLFEHCTCVDDPQ